MKSLVEVFIYTAYWLKLKSCELHLVASRGEVLLLTLLGVSLSFKVNHNVQLNPIHPNLCSLNDHLVCSNEDTFAVGSMTLS